MARPRIALVDDEADFVAPIAEYLSDLGYDVKTAGSAAACEQILERTPVDLIVLDLNMPGESGLDMLRRLGDRLGCAVLFLTANTDPIDRIASLEIGADDFVMKPVEPRELAARISGILQRRGSSLRELVRFEHASVDLTASRLLRTGQLPERMSPGEIMLVRTLARHPHKMLTRDELVELAPADSHDVNDRSIDTRMARLRRKLETEAIVTVRGHGYMFVPPFEKII